MYTNISTPTQKSCRTHSTRTTNKPHQVVLCLNNVHVTCTQRHFIYCYRSDIMLLNLNAQIDMINHMQYATY